MKCVEGGFRDICRQAERENEGAQQRLNETGCLSNHCAEKDYRKRRRHKMGVLELRGRE